MNQALVKGEGSEAVSSRRRRQGREERLRDWSGRRSRTSRSRTRRRRSRSSSRSRSRSCRRVRDHRSSSDEDLSYVEYKDLQRGNRGRSCKRKDVIPEKRSSSSKSSLPKCRFRAKGPRNEQSLRSRSNSDSKSSPGKRGSTSDEASCFWRNSKRKRPSMRKRPRRPFEVKREKCEVQSLSPMPTFGLPTLPTLPTLPRYRSEKENVDKKEKRRDALDEMKYKSTVKTEPVVMDQSNIAQVQWKQILDLENQEKDEELNLAREEMQLKDNLIQSQCEEISKLKFEAKEQVQRANSLNADVEILREKNEEKEKCLCNIKINQESMKEEIARLDENVKSFEDQVVALQESVNLVTAEKDDLQESVNQLTVEKELVEIKSFKLQRSNESLREQLGDEKGREGDLEKLRSLLAIECESGRAEIAEMRRELSKMKEGDNVYPGLVERLSNLKVENQKFKTACSMMKNDNETLKKELHELQRVNHKQSWEVHRLQAELDFVKKENNNNNVNEQAQTSACPNQLKAQELRTLPR